MYIRYWNPTHIGHFVVKDIRYLGIKDAGEDDRGIRLYSICDLMPESVGRYCNDAFFSLATHISGGDEKIVHGCKYREGIRRVNQDDEWQEELAYFNSPEAAIKVLNELCTALDAGKRYFDLTAYDENGAVEETKG